MMTTAVSEVKLFDADTLEYSGSIIVNNDNSWQYKDVTDDHMIEITRGMPLKGVLVMMINFNLVYDIISDSID
jgi:hypothetical protein